MKRAERDPVRVGDAIREVVDAGGWRDRLALGRLRDGWAQVVGAQIAAHSTPLRIAGGSLLVRTDPGAWASELALLAPTVATKADTFLGGGLVTEVKVLARADQTTTRD
jgi:predicted nucleic acid-binding Zn ribbon protein